MKCASHVKEQPSVVVKCLRAWGDLFHFILRRRRNISQCTAHLCAKRYFTFCVSKIFHQNCFRMYESICQKRKSIFFVPHRHVVADYVSFATTFLLKSHRLAYAIAPPFRKKLRLLRLFACKRAHDASAALQLFAGCEGSKSSAKNAKISFL